MHGMKKILFNIINPVDTTRYTEFTYLLNFIKNNDLKQMTILDVSSPFMMAYILSSQNKIIKTDVNLDENKNINGNAGLSFMLEDATQLSFKDNTFDLVYSISVIEHIYKNYIHAIKEMIRVVKTDGYVYLTFPVSAEHVEEWIDNNIYSHQYKENNKTFFQYRFNEEDIDKILKHLSNVEIVDMSIYWERKNEQYDKTMASIKRELNNKYLNTMKNSFINFISGFTLLKNNPSDFKDAKPFGNMSVFLKKNRGT
jgi:ubiquinone/menaquinone biosynthesis C-methylase UbiE